jgi:hypothetical protein
MRAARAFLGQVQIIVEVNGIVRTGIHAVLTARAFDRINDDQSILSLVNGVYFTGRHTGSIIAMLAHQGGVSYLDPGYLTPDFFIQFQPELSDFGLGLGIRSPIIGHMLVFTGDLAVITTIADRIIMYKYFQFIFLLLLPRH